ncbi:hypothetical protein [Chenggangzhangella methanolivorans]|uniref:Uncharacterized protein n=1 Tax=Chenggangzhangella methanolivorans TaxID=1437009 RepID=A0A9E6UN10_9HYPH|nr:hypothetical protein [Chenggangzhangella methanolivorans]QZO00556.1 hypothetical protein K6K41_02165 [Chenggangzhangella methanolivorans]
MIVWSRRVDSSLDSKAFVPQNITQSRKLYAFQKGVSALVLNNFFFSRPVAIDAGSVLSKAHEGRQLSDGEDALLDLLAGLPTYPEAHASEHAREMKLGIDNGVVDFLATTANEVEAAGFELSLIAIGPAPDEQGFNLIASLILPEVIQKAKSRGSENQWNAQIIIARIQCSIDYDSGGGLSVEGYPLYGGFDAHARRNGPSLAHCSRKDATLKRLLSTGVWRAS